MPNYYVDDHPQTSGDHHVHKAGCVHLPYVKSKTSLGYFRSCGQALQHAKRYYLTSNGCDTCLPGCYRPQNTINDKLSVPVK